MIVPLLLFAITLTSCSRNQIKRCDAVPPWLTTVPDKPSANLADTATNTDVIDVIGQLDEHDDLLRRRMKIIENHQRPCQ